MQLRHFATLPAFAFVVAASGCAATGRYFTDRGRDLGDIVNLGFGLGAGVSAQAGAIETGLGYHKDYAGLVSGTLVQNEDSDRYSHNRDIIFYSHNVAHSVPDTILRNKDYGDLETFLFITPEIYDRTRMPHLHYMTQFQVTAGFGPSFKLGANPGELIDFIFGWFGLDLYDDDKTLAETLLGTWEIEEKPGTKVILSVDTLPIATIVTPDSPEQSIPTTTDAFFKAGNKNGRWDMVAFSCLRLAANLDGQAKVWVGDATFTEPITLQDEKGNILHLKRPEQKKVAAPAEEKKPAEVAKPAEEKK